MYIKVTITYKYSTILIIIFNLSSKQMTLKFAKVLLPLSLDKSYSYAFSDLSLEIGCVVQVEFCRKLIWGVVEEIENDKPADLELNKIKPILNW
jgi:primosomal protein N'